MTLTYFNQKRDKWKLLGHVTLLPRMIILYHAVVQNRVVGNSRADFPQRGHDAVVTSHETSTHVGRVECLPPNTHSHAEPKLALANGICQKKEHRGGALHHTHAHTHTHTILINNTKKYTGIKMYSFTYNPRRI